MGMTRKEYEDIKRGLTEIFTRNQPESRDAPTLGFGIKIEDYRTQMRDRDALVVDSARVLMMLEKAVSSGEIKLEAGPEEP